MTTPDRTRAPRTQIVTHVPYIKPLAASFPNDLPVYFMDGGTEAFLKVELVFYAGSYYQPKPLVSYATTNLLRSGTATKSREEINELLDYYSTFLLLDTQKDIVSVSMFVLNKHLIPALDLLREMVEEPVFPEDEMRAFLKNQQQLHMVNQRKVQHLARSYFLQMIYGDQHPYGYRLKEDDFDHVDRDALIQHHRERFHAGNAFLLVAGKLPGNIQDELAGRFGNNLQAAGQEPVIPTYQTQSSGNRKMHLEVPDSVQSGIRVGKQLFNATHPAYHKLKVTNALLGGYYGSRLMQNIRQDKGYTYGIGSNIVSLLRSGYFFIATQTGTDVTEAATGEIYKELKTLRSEPAKKEELKTLKNYLSGSFLRSFDGPFAQSQRFKELLVFGLDPSHHDDFLKTLKSITAEEIMETARDYLHEDSMMEVVAGRKTS